MISTSSQIDLSINAANNNVTSSDETLFEQIANDIYDKGYSIRPYALPEHLAYGLLSHINTMPEHNFKRAGIGRANDHIINDFVRTDAICWINGDSDAGAQWLTWTKALQSFLNKRLFLGLFSFESHFAHYAPGDFYKTHKDAFKGEDNRVLSVVIYLNQYWGADDGGELVIYPEEETIESAPAAIVPQHITVTPGFGTIVIFLSEDFPHEVLPAKRDRYSIAGWFRLNNSIDNNIDPPS